MADIEAEIEGIPPTDFRYSTTEASDWNWSEFGEETEEMSADEAARQTAIWTTIRYKEEGMANRDVAKFAPYSREWDEPGGTSIKRTESTGKRLPESRR